MDLKITNYDLTAERLCLEQTAELPIDADFTVPDYSGEINRVIKCELVPYISSKQISGNALTVEGVASITVIFADSEGKIYSTSQEVPFKKTFETAKPLDGGWGEVSTEGTVDSCRAITERRFSIKASVKIEAQVTVTEKTEIITDIDEDCFELLRGDAAATTPLGTVQKILIMEEELALPNGAPSVARIIRTQGMANVTDHKIISGKVIVKGNLCVEVLYCDTDNVLQKQTFNIPFNQIVDIPEINELCECEATVQVCSINLAQRLSSEGDCRNFMLVAKLEVCASARCNSSVPILFDIYSTKYKCEPTFKEVKFTKIIKQVNETFMCKKNIELPENDGKILDIWCNLSTINSKLTQNSMTIFGNLIVYILYSNSDDESQVFERIIDFDYPVSLEEELIAPFCRPEVKVLSCTYSTIDKNAELVVELMIKSNVFDQNSLKLLTEIQVDENNLIKNNSTIVAYFADKGENIWEISKSFCSNKKELLEINNLSEEIIENPKMLLIPLL